VVLVRQDSGGTRASPASATYLAAGNGGAYDVRILDPVKNGLTPWKSVP
jgi:hypothetical protein